MFRTGDLKVSEGIGRGSSSFPVVLIAIVAAVATVISVVAPFFVTISPLFGVLSDLSIVVATSLTSFLVTESNEKRRSRDEARKLADFAARRVELIADNIESLIQELSDIADAKEMRRLVVFTLRNLREDSEASLKDIEQMGYVDSKPVSRETVQLSVGSSNPLASNVELVAESRLPSEIMEFYSCPTCGKSNSATLGTAAGTTRVVVCSSCGSEANFHRVASGDTKIVSRVADRLSGIGRTTPDTGWLTEDALTVSAVGPCPRCGHEVQFLGKTHSGQMERFCNTCLSNVQINARTNEVSLSEPYKIVFLNAMPAVSETFECSCGAKFLTTLRRDDEHKIYFCCFKCKTINVIKIKLKNLL